MRAGTILTQLVEFPLGRPDGAVSWQVLGPGGTLVAQGEIVPADGAVSAVITVPGAEQELAPGQLIEARELNWAYTVGGMAQTGSHRYRLEAFLPFGLSADGVRRKLGVEAHELDDESIDLVTAYGQFVGARDLTAIEVAGGYPALVICNAIEAVAAIALIPALQVSLAQKESSGTNQYQRANIDWSAIRAQLDDFVNAGHVVADPLYDQTATYTPLLVRAVRDDIFTS